MSRLHFDRPLLETLLSLVTAARYDRDARLFTADFVGGYRVTLQRTDAPSRPSLPPPAFESVEAHASGPTLAKARPALRLVGRTEAA